MKINKHIVLLLLLLVINNCIQSQTVYKISNSKSNILKLSGTSTMRNWQMYSQSFMGEAQFDFATPISNKLNAITTLTFSLNTESLKSDQIGLDDHAYAALKTDHYKEIFYKLISATVMPEKDGKHLIKTSGSLTIAGIEKTIDMDVYCLTQKQDGIMCNGSAGLLMSDFDMKPPLLLYGKTGNAVTLNFTAFYEK